VAPMKVIASLSTTIEHVRQLCAVREPPCECYAARRARSLDVRMRQVSRCVDHTVAVILEMRQEARGAGRLCYSISLLGYVY
jgi:hypothetical protein